MTTFTVGDNPSYKSDIPARWDSAKMLEFIELLAESLGADGGSKMDILLKIEHLKSAEERARAGRTMTINEIFKVCEYGYCAGCSYELEDMTPVGLMNGAEVLVCECHRLTVAETCEPCLAEADSSQKGDDDYQSAKEDARG